MTLPRLRTAPGEGSSPGVRHHDPRTHSSIPLESRIARQAGREYSLLAPRATVALVGLLRALALPPGSEVLMPAMLCAMPARAVGWAGLRTLFADISLRDSNMDLASAEARTGPQTRVLLAVPLFGHPLDVPALLSFAHRHNLIVIEDAAQAVGLEHRSVRAGSVGLASVFSFGPGKICDAGGGAALLSDDAALLRRARTEMEAVSRNAQLAGDVCGRINAALDALPAELSRRAEMAGEYRRSLHVPGADICHPAVPEGLPLWKYSVLLPDRAERDRATRHFLSQGTPATNLYSPLPPLFPAARDNGPELYPNAMRVSERIVNLPLVW